MKEQMDTKSVYLGVETYLYRSAPHVFGLTFAEDQAPWSFILGWQPPASFP